MEKYIFFSVKFPSVPHKQKKTYSEIGEPEKKKKMKKLVN